MLLKSGMSIAIEVIYTNGSGEVYQKSDNWTIAAKDGTLGGLFEMSVIVGKKEPEVITDWRK
jgi:methionine aminopeptidase